MTDFGNKLEQYVNGNLPACNHPIKAVDDNYFCHKCGKQLQPIKHVSEADQLRAHIATLEAERDNLARLLKEGADLVNDYAAENDRLTATNESMQEDAVQNTYAFGLMLKANKEQADEIRELLNTLVIAEKSFNLLVGGGGYNQSLGLIRETIQKYKGLK